MAVAEVPGRNETAHGRVDGLGGLRSSNLRAAFYDRGSVLSLYSIPLRGVAWY